MSLKASGYDPTMMIQVNGKQEAVAADTLSALLADKGIDTGARGVAVALNGAVVPRAAWADTALRADDAVEIVHAKQGG
ncbi:MAG: sulfur carrier protein ThiS [Variibacter sp.]